MLFEYIRRDYEDKLKYGGSMKERHQTMIGYYKKQLRGCSKNVNYFI